MKTDDTNPKSATGADSLDRFVRVIERIKRLIFPTKEKTLDEVLFEADMDERMRIKAILMERLEECRRLKSEKQATLKRMSNEQLILAVISIWLHNTKADTAKWSGALVEEIDERISSANVRDHRCSPEASATNTER
jgi:hypothetical protein